MHGAQMRSEGEHHGGFSFTRNKEELCVEGNSEGHSYGRGTNLERSHVQHTRASAYVYMNVCLQVTRNAQLTGLWITVLCACADK